MRIKKGSHKAALKGGLKATTCIGIGFYVSILLCKYRRLDLTVCTVKDHSIRICVIIHGVTHLIYHGITSIRKFHLIKAGICSHCEGICGVSFKIIITGCGSS